ncbi:hypothetical protein ACRFEA_17750, partial [Klebsiella pneumoniae]
MAKNSIDVYGASGKTNVLNFEPENLHLVTDKTHPLYDEWVHRHCCKVSDEAAFCLIQRPYISKTLLT